jgi:hypothetical protein
MRNALPAVLCCLAALCATPVHAAEGPRASYAGLSCGIEYSTQASPRDEPVHYTGTITGGPVVVTVDGAPAPAVLVCSVQTGVPDYHQGPAVAQASGAGTGAAVVPPTGVTFDVEPGHPVYLCTELWVLGQPAYRLDYDPDSYGDQCDGTGSAGGPDGTYADPMTVWGRYCAEEQVGPQHVGPQCVGG